MAQMYLCNIKPVWPCSHFILSSVLRIGEERGGREGGSVESRKDPLELNGLFGATDQKRAGVINI